MLPEDFIDGWLGAYGKPKTKKTFWQNLKYAIRKPIEDNIVHPMRWKMINLTCLIKGHQFKLMFKPDFRKNRPHVFHFWCDRCITDCTLTILDKKNEAA